MELESKPEVFIIESLELEDEEHHKEGEVIARTLRMSGKDPIYRYIRTKSELQHFVDEFEDCEYRYLHISCHGNNSGVAMTLDDLSTIEFAKIVGPVLDKKRLFLSTCRASNQAMADAIIQHSSCLSLAGPKRKIAFDDSVIMWTSFYHLMFKADGEKMNNVRIRQFLSRCADLIEEKMNLYEMRDGTAFYHELPFASPKTTQEST